MTDKTIKFSIKEDHENEMRTALQSVYNALSEKGYNPISQIVGYLLSRHISQLITTQEASSEKSTAMSCCSLLSKTILTYNSGRYRFG